MPTTPLVVSTSITPVEPSALNIWRAVVESDGTVIAGVLIEVVKVGVVPRTAVVPLPVVLAATSCLLPLVPKITALTGMAAPSTWTTVALGNVPLRSPAAVVLMVQPPDESDRFPHVGRAFEITPPEEMAVRKLLAAPESGITELESAFGKVKVLGAMGVVEVIV